MIVKNHPAHNDSYKRYVVGALISFLLFVIYNANFRAPEVVDTLPNTLLPVSILKYGDLTLDEFEFIVQSESQIWDASFIFGTIQRTDDGVISSYPVGPALVATPFYAAARVLDVLEPTSWLSYRITGKLTASATMALSAGILFLSLTYITGIKSSLWLTVAYGLGTGVFSTASQAMWQHGPGMLCLSLALLALIKIDTEDSASPWIAFCAGLALAMAVLCRNLNIVPSLAFTLYIAVYQRRLIIPFVIAPVLFAAWLLPHNIATYSNLSGGYDAILDSQWHRSRNLLETGLFSHSLPQGLLDTWFSPSKGVLIYSPFLIFALAAPVLLKGHTTTRLLLPLYLWIVVTSILLAKNSLWWGGTAFGPRYFLEMGIALIFLIALSYRYLPSILAYCCNGLIAISILIHSFGAFYAPCGWAESPKYADFFPERHWDWSDTEIARCIVKGAREGPIPADFSINQVVN